MTYPYHYIVFCLILLLIIIYFTVKIFRRKKRESFPLKYFKGINYLLNQRENEALEEFTKAVKVSSGNAEVYILLGNIYRNRGDFEKAIRIHKTVLSNPKINSEMEKIALLNLAFDFKSGGFLKRAIDSLEKLLLLDRKNIPALEEKAKIHIILKEWEHAINAYKKLDKLTNEYRKENYSSLYVEIAKNNLLNSQNFKAKLNLKKSFDIYKENSYTYTVMGDYYLKKGKREKALACYKNAVKSNPFAFILLRCKLNLVSHENHTELIEGNLPLYTCFKVREFIKQRRYEEGILYLKERIIKFPEEIVLQKLFFILNCCLNSDFSNIKKLKKHIKLKFVCTSCNIVLNRYVWQCPNCKNWLSLNYLK